MTATMTKIEAGRLYEVKEWFADKIANEVGRNISMCDLFAVIKETEKAVYAMLDLGYKTRKTCWIPKSVIVDITDREYDEYDGQTARPLLINSDYDECVKAFNEMWGDFE